LCAEFATERIKVDVVDERALAVDLDDGQPLAVTRFELRVAADVHLGELELHVGAGSLEHGACARAEVTALGVVQRDADYG